jgi:putative glutamine amidotransferase
MKPVIGITLESTRDPENPRSGGTLTLNWNYPQTIVEFGGTPLLIPPMADMAEIAKLIDGLLIPGGLDIDAAEYGEKNDEHSELQDPVRYGSERRLLDKVPANLPILGICYGCQFLNVYRGGKLIQHLPEVLGNESHSGGTLQEVVLEPDSALSQLVGSASVNGKSYHHQAVGALGANLRAVGHAEDGTVEALEATDRPWVFGVQWHPERTPDSQSSIRLFRSFVDAAAEFSLRRTGPAR